MRISEYLEKHKLTQGEFGLKLGVSAGMVWQWIRRETNPEDDNSRPISALRAKQIHEITAGEISKYELRPDVFEKEAA